MSSIKRMHQVMEILRLNSKYGLPNKRISDLLAIPPSSSYRVLKTLEQYGFVHRREKDLRYFLGDAPLKLSQAFLDKFTNVTIIRDALEILHTKTGYLSFYTIPSDSDEHYCIIIEVRGSFKSRFAVEVGEITPLHTSSAGKALLSLQKKPQRRRLYQNIKKRNFPPVRLTEIEKEIKEIQETKFAFGLDDFGEGINSLSAPVNSRNRQPSGSITIIGSSASLHRENLDTLAPLMVEIASSMEQSQ